MKTAWSEWVPTGSGVVVTAVATPDVTVTGLPMSVVPSSNCTVPAAADGLTVAVRVTAVPYSWGDGGDAVSVVPVVAATVKDAVPVEPA